MGVQFIYPKASCKHLTDQPANLPQPVMSLVCQNPNQMKSVGSPSCGVFGRCQPLSTSQSRKSTWVLFLHKRFPDAGELMPDHGRWFISRRRKKTITIHFTMSLILSLLVLFFATSPSFVLSRKQCVVPHGDGTTDDSPAILKVFQDCNTFSNITFSSNRKYNAWSPMSWSNLST